MKRPAKLVLLIGLGAGALVDYPPAMAVEPAGGAITWMVRPIPPFNQLRGTHASPDALDDPMLKLIAKVLPEMEHRVVAASVSRIVRTLRSGEQVCAYGGIRTAERDQFSVFTITHTSPPPVLVVLGTPVASVPKSANGRASMAALFAQQRLRGVFASDGSYGPELEALFKAASQGASPPLYVAGGDDGRLLKMVALGRADYTIEHESVLDDADRRNPNLHISERLTMLQIDELKMPEYGILCPRNDWGRAVIHRIDEAIPALIANPAYRHSVDRWQSPGALNRYRVELERFYKLRAQGHANPGAGASEMATLPGSH